jgi:hypothetical protein
VKNVRHNGGVVKWGGGRPRGGGSIEYYTAAQPN